MMMLLTFDQFAEVPEKVHIFYRYAFQTLYSLHDAAKESFQRRRKTGLNEDDFCKVFSFFCLLSYKEMDYSFTETSIRGYIDSAKERACVKVDTDLFIEESIESVNLLYKDGNTYSFVHRSFQEYFCAFCLVSFFQKRIDRIVESFSSRPGDSVLSMLYEMNPELIEQNFITAQFDVYKNEIASVLSKSSSDSEAISRIDLSLIFVGALAEKDREKGQFVAAVMYSGLKSTKLLSVIGQLCPSVFSGLQDEIQPYPSPALFKYLRSDLKKSIDVVDSKTYVVRINVPSRTCIIDYQELDSDRMRENKLVELSEKAWSRIGSPSERRKHVAFASATKARYVALSKFIAAVARRNKKRGAIDDELFS